MLLFFCSQETELVFSKGGFESKKIENQSICMSSLLKTLQIVDGNPGKQV